VIDNAVRRQGCFRPVADGRVATKNFDATRLLLNRRLYELEILLGG